MGCGLAGQLRRAPRADSARGRTFRAAARQMAARQRRRVGVRRLVREETLLPPPAAPRAGQGYGPRRAPVARDRCRQAARRARAGDRGNADRAGGEARCLSRAPGRPHLRRRPVRQPDDALPARRRSFADAEGFAAPAESRQRRMSPHRRLVLATLLLALCVIVVGAYVRLSHAGLGCPDWPFCYGQAMPGDHLGADALGRAWKEMAHRYLAGGLGLLIAALFVVAWRSRSHRALSIALVLVVLFQATLGMWTVTLLLRPAIVAAHLLGGMATLSLLVWLFLAQGRYAPALEARAVRWPALAALVAVVAQIALGGWVSANYAALACRDLPLCQGALVPAMDFGHAFHVLRALGETSDGARLPNEALTAIHWTHRMFAL